MKNQNKKIAAKIIGVGSFVPNENKPIANQDLINKGVQTDDAWIIERTGIRQRYIANDLNYIFDKQKFLNNNADFQPTLTSDLAVAAAKNALQNANLNANDIDLIIVATSTPDYVFPSTACLVQQKLANNNENATAFDVQAVCSGFVYALATAEKFIASGSHKRALVIGAEIFSNILDWNDRSTCVLFGDGAGAVILEAVDNETTQNKIIGSKLLADGSYNKILNVPGQIHQGTIFGDPVLKMDGQAVFKFAVKSLSSVAEQICQEHNLSVTENVDFLIPHQANERIIQAVGKRLKLSADKVISTVHLHANTSAASVPLALDFAVKNGHIKINSGQTILLEAIGGGFAWGAVLLKI